MSRLYLAYMHRNAQEPETDQVKHFLYKRVVSQTPTHGYERCVGDRKRGAEAFQPDAHASPVGACSCGRCIAQKASAATRRSSGACRPKAWSKPTTEACRLLGTERCYTNTFPTAMCLARSCRRPGASPSVRASFNVSTAPFAQRRAAFFDATKQTCTI